MHKKLLFFLTIIIALSSCKKKENFEEKVIYETSKAKVSGFDPIFSPDLYSARQIAKVYEGLYEYHYLKRPYELIPNLASTMPEVSDSGLVYTIPLKKGVLFHNDQCFPEGKGREMKANDVVFSIKRLADPKLQSTGWWILQNKLVGLDKWREKNTSMGQVSYEEVVEGIKAIDDYTVQFKLKKPFPQFLYALAMVNTYIHPREAVEYYKEDFLNHPVGTGPFTTQEYTQSNKIVFTKNPKYRLEYYPSEGDQGDKEKGLLADAGKPLPLVDKVIVNIQVESQPRWLSFEKGKVDYLTIPKDNFDQAVTPNKEINASFEQKGISLHISPALDLTFIGFNHEDPLFSDNVKLRQAMSMAYDIDEVNQLFYNDRGIKAETIIPPGIAGYNSDYTNPYRQYDLEKAKQLLAEAGYPNGDGLPEFTYCTVSTTTNRQMSEYFVKSMNKIGIKIKVSTSTWPDFIKRVDTKQAQMFGMAWGADYPDAENFLQLLYSKNAAPGSNNSNYSDPVFDSLYLIASVMQHSPERTKLYEQLNQFVAEKIPLIFGVHRASYIVTHTWFKNYKYAEFDQTHSKYYNIDLIKKKEALPAL